MLTDLSPPPNLSPHPPLLHPVRTPLPPSVLIVRVPELDTSVSPPNAAADLLREREGEERVGIELVWGCDGICATPLS